MKLTESRTLSDVDPKCFHMIWPGLDLSPISAQRKRLYRHLALKNLWNELKWTSVTLRVLVRTCTVTWITAPTIIATVHAALTTKNTIAALFRSPILYSITYSSSSLLLNFLYIAVHIFASQEIVTISRAAHTEVLVSHRGRQLLSLKRDLYWTSIIPQ